MQRDYIEQRNGGLYLTGTRISLDSIAHSFREGQSPESILEDFDTLTLEQIYGAITYYLANQPAVDEYLINQKRRAEAMRKCAEPLPAELRSRLDAAREKLHAGRSA